MKHNQINRRQFFQFSALGAGSLALPAAMRPTSSPHQGTPAGATDESGKAALPQLETLANNIVKSGGVPGLSIAVVFKDEVVYLKGFGVREAGKPDAVDADTVFQIASMSKPIASTVVAGLVSDGVVSWDDPVVKHMPDFQMRDPWVTRNVTIRDFFAHRSGLPGEAGDELQVLGYTRDEILRRLRFVDTGNRFRSQYSYSNSGITIGGVAASTAAGGTWEEVALRRLYVPLGMTSTSSRYADFVARKNRAALHIPEGGIMAASPQKWTPALKHNADAHSPAGGVSSSARDLAQWMRLQLGNGNFDGKPLIKPDAITQTHQPVIMRGPDPIIGPGFYGLGWTVDYDDDGRVIWGHAGAFSVGARTFVNLIEAEQLGIIVLTNAFPTGVPEGIASSFFDLVHYGKPQRDWVEVWNKIFAQLATSVAAAVSQYATPPKQPSAALPAQAYAGQYANDYAGEIEVVARGDGLELHLGPNKQAFPLKHWDRDMFLYFPGAELPDVPMAATFIIGPDGKASQVVLDSLNTDGFGTFRRLASK